METAHGIKVIRGEGKSRKDILQIYQHDGNAKMSVQETNQTLVKARDEIIMKLYEALQKCKQGIKYDIRMDVVFQRSRMNDKGEMENVMTSPVYRRDKIEELLKQDKIDAIEERFDKFIDNFWEYIEELMLEGSGWSFMYIKCIDLKIYDYDVIAGGTYLDLPKKIKNKQACINVKNHDNMCFKWAILSALHHNEAVCVLQGKVIFPEKDKATMKVKNFQNKWRVPFVVYADFESLSVKPEAQEEETRKIINNHVPIAVSYSVCSIDPKWRREVKCYTGTDCSEWFMKEMLNLVEEVKHLQENSSM